MPIKEALLNAGHGQAYRLEPGQRIHVINLHGQQVVDTWAVNAMEPAETMSMAHTRSCLDKLGPEVGDCFYTNRRRPILRLEADTSPGVHDTLLSACDEERYRLLGHPGGHRNCCANFRLALGEHGIELDEVPNPWNMFENVELGPGRALAIHPPAARPGDTVTLAALIPCIIIFSACPMDIAPTNGLDRIPKDIRLAFD